MIGRNWTLSRKPDWITIELDDIGVTIDLRKPRQSERYEVGVKTPKWVYAMEQVRLAAMGEEVSEEDIVVPAAEMEALAAFLAKLTTSVHGADIEPGEPLIWGELDEDTQCLFWEQLPLGTVQRVWGEVITKADFEDHPDRAVEIGEQLAAASEEE